MINRPAAHGNPDSPAAYIYSQTVNGRPGKFADTYSNDQDWTIVSVA